MLAFHCAIRKYGVETFELRVIDECVTKEKLDELERFWIAKLKTFGEGYNMTPGGDGGSLPGRVVREETRIKIATIAKKRYAEGHGALMRSCRKKGDEHPFAGKDWGRKGPLTESAKAKISTYRKGRALSSSHKAAIAASCNGRHGVRNGTQWSEIERAKHVALRYLKKKPVFGFDEVGTCVVAYLSIEEAMADTGLGRRILTGNRTKYRPKYVNGVTYKRSNLTIDELKARS